jgi:ribosome maturation protein SDO1
VLEYRQGIEKDLDNVLQTDQIFLNVSKGQCASKEDLLKCFKTEDSKAIVLEILKKGELQVGEKERSQQLSNLNKDIAVIVAEKCINSETKRPYPVSTIEKVINDLHFSANPNKSAKQQVMHP